VDLILSVLLAIRTVFTATQRLIDLLQATGVYFTGAAHAAGEMVILDHAG